MTTIFEREKDGSIKSSATDGFVMMAEDGFWTSTTLTQPTVYDPESGRAFVQSGGTASKTVMIQMLMPGNDKTQKQGLIKFFDGAGWIRVTDSDFFSAPVRLYVQEVDTKLWEGTDVLEVTGIPEISRIGGVSENVLRSATVSGGNATLSAINWTNSTTSIAEIVVEVTLASATTIGPAQPLELKTNRGDVIGRIGGFSVTGSPQSVLAKRIILSSLGGFSDSGTGFISPAGSKLFSVAPGQTVNVSAVSIALGVSVSGTARLVAKVVS